ncbi:uncharacterized protein TrAtP1_009505 [Trichoderma atroviride]|uniref:Uncharacterized protein n=1 Tax=Hypocrea atroviridis (strain ATCC 20476 / IMI 206040) TaxID=452589 RepID=G9NLE0_HYPAI|nr:uncharacterized protein TRIATDRAFT_305507 [Trichoderma atroviride IMI 206040]EHK48704.1 hypothetical protein TRIATDRAFT_305507 [Trichoderma atroviride IMI 206040]UKZ68470.1 hypothetical protein TrAtP1_009505 [Trichoderma atroviride]
MSKHVLPRALSVRTKAGGQPPESIKVIYYNYELDFAEIETLRPVNHYALMSSSCATRLQLCRSLNIEHSHATFCSR